MIFSSISCTKDCSHPTPEKDPILTNRSAPCESFVLILFTPLLIFYYLVTNNFLLIVPPFFTKTRHKKERKKNLYFSSGGKICPVDSSPSSKSDIPELPSVPILAGRLRGDGPSNVIFEMESIGACRRLLICFELHISEDDSGSEDELCAGGGMLLFDSAHLGSSRSVEFVC